jgi:predicted nucleic acid-binding Zn ribbon protein
MKKAFVPPTIVFRGSGWAKKDRSAGATKTRATGDAESGAKAADASGDDGTTDAAKPAPSAEKPGPGSSSAAAD